MNIRRRLIDLIAFLAVLGTGTTLIAIGIRPESFAVVVVAIAGLYGAWFNVGQHSGPPSNGTAPQRDDQDPG